MIQKWQNKIGFPIFPLLQLQKHATAQDKTSILNMSD